MQANITFFSRIHLSYVKKVCAHTPVIYPGFPNQRETLPDASPLISFSTSSTVTWL